MSGSVLGAELGARVLLQRSDALADAIDALTRARLPVSFWEGFTGLAWLIARSGEVEPEALDPIDDSLLELLGREEWGGHYDAVTGLVGIGVYAFERQSVPMLARIVEHLLAMSSLDDDGRRWWTPPHLLPDHQRAEHPDGHVDLGVAHGMGGAVWLLAAASGISQTRPQALPALAETVAWLRARPPVAPWAYFPSWSVLEGPEEPARLAWCYGDLGMAVVLGQAAQVLNDSAVSEWTAALALGCASRPDELTGITESFVCHGSAGNALLFDRLAQMIPRPELAMASEQWRAHAAAAPPLADGGLLLGSGGVELCLSAVDPTWDIALLARMP